MDPQRDIEQYIEDAKSAGCQIKYVFLTHFHADFLAGHIELRDRAGAEICLGQRAEAEFKATKLKDGDRVEFGDTKLQILETSGHASEGISILIYDLAKDANKPQAVLTGDTLFIGDVGRTDLLTSLITADELSDMLYDSLTNKLVKLPDATLVYPAHGVGSMCGKSLSKDTVSTTGVQKKFNYALQPMSRDEFKRLDANHPIVLIADEGGEEEAVTRLGRIGFDNVAGYLVHGMGSLRQHPELTTKIDRITAVALAVHFAVPDAPLVLDARSEKEWSAGHIAGSVNIPLTHLRERSLKIEMGRIQTSNGYRSRNCRWIVAQL